MACPSSRSWRCASCSPSRPYRAAIRLHRRRLADARLVAGERKRRGVLRTGSTMLFVVALRRLPFAEVLTLGHLAPLGGGADRRGRARRAAARKRARRGVARPLRRRRDRLEFTHGSAGPQQRSLRRHRRGARLGGGAGGEQRDAAQPGAAGPPDLDRADPADRSGDRGDADRGGDLGDADSRGLVRLRGAPAASTWAGISC